MRINTLKYDSQDQPVPKQQPNTNVAVGPLSSREGPNGDQTGLWSIYLIGTIQVYGHPCPSRPRSSGTDTMPVFTTKSFKGAPKPNRSSLFNWPIEGHALCGMWPLISWFIWSSRNGLCNEGVCNDVTYIKALSFEASRVANPGCEP